MTEAPQPARMERVRALAAAEIKRIGLKDFAGRSGMDQEEVKHFVNGGNPSAYVWTALNFYDFGEYADLRQLMGCYFHEDYSGDSPLQSWEPVVDQFVQEELMSMVKGAAGNIDRLLSSVKDDRQLGPILEELGCYFVFHSVPISERQWLRAVRKRLVQAYDRGSRGEAT